MSENKVINFAQKRQQVLEEKRRQFERVMFQNFLGCYSVVDSLSSIYPITIVDISEKGCLIEVPANKHNDTTFEKNKEINLRFYFTKDSYLPVVARIKHSSDHVDEAGREVVRYGCEFDQNSHSTPALHLFVQFIAKFAENSCTDKGDQKIYFL